MSHAKSRNQYRRLFLILILLWLLVLITAFFLYIRTTPWDFMWQLTRGFFEPPIVN